jgi:hypothetical protein
VSYEAWGDNDDDYASVSQLIDDGWLSAEDAKALEDKVALLERALAEKPLATAPEIKGTLPLVLYFGSEADRDEFIATFQVAMPSLESRKVQTL